MASSVRLFPGRCLEARGYLALRGAAKAASQIFVPVELGELLRRFNLEPFGFDIDFTELMHCGEAQQPKSGAVVPVL